jgi:hypothetical protein
MRFLILLSQLIDKYGSNIAFTDNQVCLLGPHEPPQIADHFIYSSMPTPAVDHLIQSYRGHFPDDLLKLYAYANGLDMFRTMRKISEEISLPASKISVYGMPILADRKHIEPLNICIEDLSRLPGTPRNWLKFGCWRAICQGEFANEYDLYVDTDDGKAYQVERCSTSLSIIRGWQSIDDCLCGLFEEETQTITR